MQPKYHRLDSIMIVNSPDYFLSGFWTDYDPRMVPSSCVEEGSLVLETILTSEKDLTFECALEEKGDLLESLIFLNMIDWIHVDDGGSMLNENCEN